MSEGRDGMAKGAQGQFIWRAGQVQGQGEGDREKEGRRMGHRWQSREMLEGRAAQTEAERRSGVRIRAGQVQS